MTADIDREKLRELCERATPGAWRWWTSCSWRRLSSDARGNDRNGKPLDRDGGVICPYVCRDGHPDLIITEEDADFIAAARTALPALLDLTEAQAEKIDNLSRSLDHANVCLDGYASTHEQLLTLCEPACGRDLPIPDRVERLAQMYKEQAAKITELKAENARLKEETDAAQDIGADFVLDHLAEALGVKQWTPCDGTETWDGDVAGSLYGILRQARVLDPETDEPATSRIRALESERNQLKAENASLRERANAPEDLTWFWEIVDRDGLANVGSDERQALADLCRHSAERDQLRKQVEGRFVDGMRHAAEIALDDDGHFTVWGEDKNTIVSQKTAKAAHDAILSAASALEQGGCND